MNPLVSIIVPIYNVEKYIIRCLNSLINQTLKNVEIILIDDESPDNCGMICDEYKKIDSRIKVLHKKNEGLGLARNSGLKMATGKYVAFVDSDDYIELNMYEELCEIAELENADAVISGSFINENKNGKIYNDSIINQDKIYDGNTRDLALEMIGALPEYSRDFVYEPSACKGIYRVSTIKQNNILFHSERELISEDTIFHLDLFQVTSKVICLAKSYYHYCENEDSLTKKYSKNRFNRNLEFYDYLINRLSILGYDKISLFYANRLLLAWARVAISQSVSHYKGETRFVKEEIVKICKATHLVNVLKSYPILKLPLKQRIFVLAMRFNLWRTMYILALVNNKIKE